METGGSGAPAACSSWQQQQHKGQQSPITRNAPAPWLQPLLLPAAPGGFGCRPAAPAHLLQQGICPLSSNADSGVGPQRGGQLLRRQLRQRWLDGAVQPVQQRGLVEAEGAAVLESDAAALKVQCTAGHASGGSAAHLLVKRAGQQAALRLLRHVAQQLQAARGIVAAAARQVQNLGCSEAALSRNSMQLPLACAHASAVCNNGHLSGQGGQGGPGDGTPCRDGRWS